MPSRGRENPRASISVSSRRGWGPSASRKLTVTYISLIPLLPGLGAAINGIVGIRYFSRRAAGALACATMVAALGLALAAFWQLLALPPDARAYDVIVAQWIP